MIQGIVFDMDGLMFDTERLAQQAWLHAGRQMGCEIPDEMILGIVGLDVEASKRIFLEHLGSDLDFDEFRQTRLDYVKAYIEENGVPQKPGLSELLGYLNRHHFKTVVATSTDSERTNYYFEKTGLRHYFDFIICGDSVVNRKPAPDIYLSACDAIHIAPDKCLALEDSPAGILAAYRAGMMPVMIPDLIPPDEKTKKLLFAQLSSLNDVVELLENVNLDA